LVEIYTQKMGDVWYAVAAEKESLYAVSYDFSEAAAISRVKANLPKSMRLNILKGEGAFFRQVTDVMHQIFMGQDFSLKFNLDMSYLTPYQRKVLLCVSEVPKGYVTTYGSVSKVAGGGARAVGNVMARNPFPLIIPCHRVVRHDLSLGGFGHGLKMKRDLLRREDVGYKKPKVKVINDRKLNLFPVRLVKGLYED